MILAPPPRKLWTPRPTWHRPSRRQVPRWRRGLAALNMAVGDQVLGTGGAKAVRAGTGEWILSDGTDACTQCCDDSLSVGPPYAHVTITGATACTSCYINVDASGNLSDTFTLFKLTGCKYGVNALYSATTLRWHETPSDPADCGVLSTSRACTDPITCTTDHIRIFLEKFIGGWRIQARMEHTGSPACTCCDVSFNNEPFNMTIPAFWSDGFAMGTCTGDGTTVSNTGLCIADPTATPAFGCPEGTFYPQDDVTFFTGGTIDIALSNTP